MSEYDEQAKNFMVRFAVGIHIAFAKENGCPPWREKGKRLEGCPTCSTFHGHQYRITLRKNGKSVRFDYWGSFADAQNKKGPSFYDILSCIASEATGETDPDEIYRELGPMVPSQAIAISKAAKRWQKFFNAEELEALGEIR